MAWWLLGYFGVGLGLDCMLSQTDAKEWEEATGESFTTARVLTVFFWPLIFGVCLLLLIFTKR